jgi:biotin carboxyl carrier protein
MGGNALPESVAGRLYADFRTHERMKQNFKLLVQQLARARPGFIPIDSPPTPFIGGEVQRVDNLFFVKAPIVGAFYEAPSPDAPPFVNIGDHVMPGKVLCIIESMKLMNEVEAEMAGVQYGRGCCYATETLAKSLPALPVIWLRWR